jgi:hypothetical protein
VLAEAPPDAACPECRQKGIFEGALLMKKLAGAINRRCIAKRSMQRQCTCCLLCSRFGVYVHTLTRENPLPMTPAADLTSCRSALAIV